MTLESLRLKEASAYRELNLVSAMVQDQHRLPRGDALKYSYDQMTVLFNRLDAARKAHDDAYWELDSQLYPHLYGGEG